MNEYEIYNYMPQDPKAGCLSTLIGAILAFALCALLGGCKAPCGITEETALHDTTYITAWKSDSVFVHDSIYTEKVLKGDTVLIYKYKEQVKWKERLSVDTLYVSKTDTVKVEKVVQAKRNMWQELSDNISFLVIGAIFSLVGIRLWRWYKEK